MEYKISRKMAQMLREFMGDARGLDRIVVDGEDVVVTDGNVMITFKNVAGWNEGMYTIKACRLIGSKGARYPDWRAVIELGGGWMPVAVAREDVVEYVGDIYPAVRVGDSRLPVSTLERIEKHVDTRITFYEGHDGRDMLSFEGYMAGEWVKGMCMKAGGVPVKIER